MLVLGSIRRPRRAAWRCAVWPVRIRYASSPRLEVVDPRRSAELLAPLITETLGRSRTAARLISDAIVAGSGPGALHQPAGGHRHRSGARRRTRDCGLRGLLARWPRRGHGDRVTAVTDARRREVYWARYVGRRARRGPRRRSSGAAVAARLDPASRVIGAGGELYASVFGAAYRPGGPALPRSGCGWSAGHPAARTARPARWSRSISAAPTRPRGRPHERRPSRSVALIPRWWHIPAVVGLESELFGDEAWTGEPSGPSSPTRTRTTWWLA